MYAAIRHAKAKAGSAEELARRIKAGAIPIINEHHHGAGAIGPLRFRQACLMGREGIVSKRRGSVDYCCTVRTTSAVIRQRSTPTAGPIMCGCPIWR